MSVIMLRQNPVRYRLANIEQTMIYDALYKIKLTSTDFTRSQAASNCL
jgi:hypothetical protein